MVTYRDFVQGFQQLGIESGRPVIVHSSLSSFGEIRGGATTLLGALLACFDGVIAPTFTYKTLLIPEEGPQNNGLAYGSGGDNNRMAEFFTPSMPVDPLMGKLPAELAKNPRARRSHHPICSFAGIGAEDILETQTLKDPFAPIRKLAEIDGWVLLLGVDHSSNTGLHLAEQIAGRRSFIRWALTPEGVAECPGLGGCSNGFEKATALLAPITHQVTIGDGLVQALPIPAMLELFSKAVQQDALAYLCDDITCQYCEAVRMDARTG
jgi:aminoglycoside 3-N-acetyltransferase